MFSVLRGNQITPDTAYSTKPRKEKKSLRVMAFVSTFQPLVFVIIACSLVAFSNGTWCSSYQTCATGYVCCNNVCDYGNCLGQYCILDSDCSSDESCCNRKCHYGSNCIGVSCSTDGDCKSYENCCYGLCSNSDCYSYYDPTPVIVGSIFGATIFICLFSMCIFCACRRRQTTVRPGRVIVEQRVTTVTTTRTVPQSNPHYPGQMPPSYQQGYPYQPLPQYEQHQAAAPPPYNPGTTRRCEQPPPYSATTQGKLGGVYAPQTSYGAVQLLQPHLSSGTGL